MVKARLEVSLPILRENARIVRRWLDPGVALCGVVKADAYGHGLYEASCALTEGGASCVAVARPDEGAVLREAGFRGAVVVMGPPDDAGLIARYGLEAMVAEPAQAIELARAAREAGSPVRLHLKLDTGMNRLGARTTEQVQAVTEAIAEHPETSLAAVFSHLGAADAQDTVWLERQLARFDQLAKPFGPQVIRHIANSAAMLRDPKTHFGMVRPGLALYGCSPSETSPLLPGMKPALRWLAPVERVEVIPAGEGIGYGPYFITQRETLVATLAIGYGDGYHRIVNRGCALISGAKAPILGAVCMDHILVDATGIDVKPGDEAVMLGEQRGAMITPDEVADAWGTIAYEVLLSRLPRMGRAWIG